MTDATYPYDVGKPVWLVAFITAPLLVGVPWWLDVAYLVSLWLFAR